MKCFSQALPDSDTYDSTLYIKNNFQSKKNNQQKRHHPTVRFPQKKQRFHQEF